VGVETLRYLLDTHTWIWWHIAQDKLPPEIRTIIGRPPEEDSLLLNPISVWEFCKLVEKNRLTLAVDISVWLETAFDMSGLFYLPLTPEIICASTRLPGVFHSDPADQLLAATARIFNATLLTKDKRLLDYPHIKTMWD
jgi:PIN domain nuclease of toxin-antitoxin system